MTVPFGVRLAGTICELDPRGYGFVKVAGVYDHVFFHCADCRDVVFAALREGDRVECEAGPGRPGRGPRAVHVWAGKGADDGQRDRHRQLG
jgi:cold shock CspA family protein